MPSPPFTGEETAPETMFNSKFYSELAAELEQETDLRSSVLETLQKGDAKYSLPAPWLCSSAQNTHWLLVIWPLPQTHWMLWFIYQLVWSERGRLQHVQRAFLNPVYLSKDPVWETLSLSLVLISSNV